MTNAQLSERLAALEKTVQRLEARIGHTADPGRPWWVEDAGRFKDDPVFEEILRLGQAYRESLRPRRKKGKRAHP